MSCRMLRSSAQVAIGSVTLPLSALTALKCKRCLAEFFQELTEHQLFIFVAVSGLERNLPGTLGTSGRLLASERILDTDLSQREMLKSGLGKNF